MPLLVNEALWSSGMAIMNQCYSTCGLAVVPAQNISSTLFQLSSVVFLSLGNAVGIIMGQMLGAGSKEAEVRDTNAKLLALSVASGIVFGILMASVSGLFTPRCQKKIVQAKIEKIELKDKLRKTRFFFLKHNPF